MCEIIGQFQQTPINNSNNSLINDICHQPASNVLKLAKSDINPEVGDINSSNWINKIEQLTLIHNWNDTIKFYLMQSKLCGITKFWYNDFRKNNKFWQKWKVAVISIFHHMRIL